MRLGIAGLGHGHGIQGHADHAAVTGWKLAAVHDLRPDAMAAARAKYGSDVLACSSFREMLTACDAVVIATDDEGHPYELLQAIQEGRHVLVEKPLAGSYRDLPLVRQAFAEAEAAGLIVTSCHPRRFDPPYRQVATQLPEWVRRFGILAHIELDFSYPTPMAEWKNERSLMLDHFTHELDWLRWVLGDGSFTADLRRDEADIYVAQGSFGAAGVSFSCIGTRLLTADDLPQGRIYPETIRLRFGRATVTINTRLGGLTIEYPGAQIIDAWPFPPTDYDVRFRGIMSNFLGAVRGKAQNYLSPPDLLTNIEAALELRREGHYIFDPPVYME